MLSFYFCSVLQRFINFIFLFLFIFHFDILNLCILIIFISVFCLTLGYFWSLNNFMKFNTQMYIFFCEINCDFCTCVYNLLRLFKFNIELTFKTVNNTKLHCISLYQILHSTKNIPLFVEDLFSNMGCSMFQCFLFVLIARFYYSETQCDKYKTQLGKY